MNDHKSKVMNQSSLLSQPKMMNPMSISMMMNQQQQQQQQQPPMMMTRGGVAVGGYGMWPPPLPPLPPHLPVQEQLSYNNNNNNPNSNNIPNVPVNFPGFKAMGRGGNWKNKGINNDKKRRKGKTIVASGSAGGGSGYKPPNINDLQQENRLKARKFFQKKKFGGNNNNNNNNNSNVNRKAPYAPRNTSSFIIRAKKSGGIASLVSPCPVTPAVLPTPMFSPSTEVLGDMAKEEWGVDGYGSMNGLIRLRSPGDVAEAEAEDEEDEEGGGSSESDVEEHLEVERRLDHDLSRFEMIYPHYGHGGDYNNSVLENRVDDQDTHIAQVEEENLILKERLFLMERELNDLRRRLLSLERHHQGPEEINEEIVENESENDNGSRGGDYSHSHDEVIEENNQGAAKNVESDNIADDMVKDLSIVEAKEDTSNDCGVQVNDGNDAHTQVGNDSADGEVKEASVSATMNDAVAPDVCMTEVEPKQDEKANL